MALTKNSQIDLNGNEMILDADADTSITADTDDQIDIKVGGTDTVVITGGAMALKGATPTLTIGDAGAEDTKIVFDGNAQDFYIGLDDSADDLLIGLGSTVGTTPAISIDENVNVTLGSALTVDGFGDSTGHYISLRSGYSPDESGGIGFQAADQSGAHNDALGLYGHDGITFYTAQSERMRIGPNGQLSVGIAGSGEKLYIYGDDASQYLGLFYHDGNNNNRYGIRIVAGTDDASGVIYHLRCDDGDGHVLGYITHESGTLAITQASDERLKENIVDSTLEGINTLKNIKQREFNFKRDTSKTKVTGYVAQEMESVYPAAISVMDATQDGSAPEDDLENPYKTLSKTALIDVLIKAMQEQQVIIDDLKARITTLEGS